MCEGGGDNSDWRGMCEKQKQAILELSGPPQFGADAPPTLPQRFLLCTAEFQTNH